MGKWFTRDEHSNGLYLWEGKNGYVQIWQEYTEWFGSYNWQNFTLINVAYENEGYINHREIALGILGLRVRILWSHGEETEPMKEIKQRMVDIKVHPDAAVDIDDILNGKFRESRASQSTSSGGE